MMAKRLRRGCRKNRDTFRAAGDGETRRGPFRPFLEVLENRVLPSMVAAQLLKDINAGNKGSDAAEFVALNGYYYFSASDGAHGNELWRTDGTSAGTALVKDINAGKNSSSPHYLTNVNGVLYFVATDAAHGAELWKSED